MAPTGVTAPAAGVMPTSPATAPEAAPRLVACPLRTRSTASQPSTAAQAATVVLTQASPATPSAVSALPALKPNHPIHSRPAPSMVSGRLWGRMGTRPKPRRRPIATARKNPATPALICTTVPPAKSMGAAREENQPWSLRMPPPYTMCARGR